MNETLFQKKKKKEQTNKSTDNFLNKFFKYSVEIQILPEQRLTLLLGLYYGYKSDIYMAT